MLTADAELDVGTYLAALISSHLDQLAYAVLVEVCERIRLIDLALVVVGQELACVVTGEAELTFSAVSTIVFLTNASSFLSPTRGTMISGMIS